jgi:hypothetical protein
VPPPAISLEQSRAHEAVPSRPRKCSKRADDEGRTLIQAALASSADLDVTDTELRLTLAPQSSPHRTRAIAALCDDLNRTPTRFPGTRLTLRFAIHQPAADPGG